MSMNLTLHASQKRGSEQFMLLQTPTEVTHQILSMKDRYQAYVRWLRTSRGWNWNNPEHVRDYRDMKERLRGWLKAHPEHVWGMI